MNDEALKKSIPSQVNIVPIRYKFYNSVPSLKNLLKNLKPMKLIKPQTIGNPKSLKENKNN